MRIVVVGGGPAGLYFSLLFKKKYPESTVQVFERGDDEASSGLGIVLTESTVSKLAQADEESALQIRMHACQWTHIDIHVKQTCVRSQEPLYYGLARHTLLEILRKRCQTLGVHLIFDEKIEPSKSTYEADLIVISDGAHSSFRHHYRAHFKPKISEGKNHYIWLGTTKHWSAFNFLFESTRDGWFCAHTYPIDEASSTLIIEVPDSTWQKGGFEQYDASQSLAYCETIFSKYLEGHALIEPSVRSLGASHSLSNMTEPEATSWKKFQMVQCDNWIYHRDFLPPMVLIGDAAHTTHFSVGAGTRLAMEDAIALSDSLGTKENLSESLVLYEKTRRPFIELMQHMGQQSQRWFEAIEKHIEQDAYAFSASLLNRCRQKQGQSTIAIIE